MNVETFLIAVSLALIIEGLFPALFPNKWKRYVLKIGQESTQVIRTIGIGVMLFGAVLLFIST
ncbi:DUF2065 domain-containing protein [Thalassotalea piscium]